VLDEVIAEEYQEVYEQMKVLAKEREIRIRAAKLFAIKEYKKWKV
jgi:hypothetical protein